MQSPPGGYGPPGAPPPGGYGSGGYGPPPGGYGPPPGGYGPSPGGYGPPPGGYSPPPGGYSPPPAGPGGYGPPPGTGPSGFGGPPQAPGGQVPGLTPAAATVLKEKNFITIVLLSIVTCGIYGIVAHYQRRSELREATGDTSINPGLDLLLAFVTCFLWLVYVAYRDAQRYAAAFRAAGVQREDRSTMVLIVTLLSLHIIGWYWLCDDHNALGRLARGEYR